jgi:hypothetical protein
MRGSLLAVIGSGVLLSTACSSSSGTTTSTGTTGGTTTAGTTTGTTTGASSGTTTGTSSGTTTGGGMLDAGQPCTDNSQCQSGACGANGEGRCCGTPCTSQDPACAITSCNSQGACVYPAAGGACGMDLCSGYLVTKHTCDGQGGCMADTPVACPNNFACQDTTTCKTTCNAAGDCAFGSYCDTSTHQCVAQLANGPCTSNTQCLTGICGIHGTGNCCLTTCDTSDATCGATDCDPVSAACVYPTSTTPCGQSGSSCVDSGIVTNACNGAGACAPNSTPCDNHYACNAAGTACLTTCSVITDCASGFYCNTGACLAQHATGPCSSDEICTSGICGVSGTGHFCCTVACSITDPICAATDCNATGACVYPGKTTSCGDAGSCTNGTQTAPTVCDGMGSCPPPPVSDCTPYVCGANACLTACTTSADCITGDFCDTGKSACCSGLASNGTILVDGKTGQDNACCGLGSNASCQTITRAMGIINDAQAQNVTINAKVNGGGGDWAPATEVYPINLGWGAELNAPGVYFLDPDAGVFTYDAGTPVESAIFDVTAFASDTLHYASIVGSAKSVVGVGMDSTNAFQTADISAIAIEKDQTLYIANASVNGSASNTNFQDILVQAGATLTLGQDQSAGVTGTVQVGNNLGAHATNGFQGIVCGTGVSLGCTINDATLSGGQSSVVIQGQEVLDLNVQDFGSVTLSSAPVFGVPPKSVGFGNCPSKQDGVSGNPGVAVVAQGPTQVSLKNAKIQCITGVGVFVLSSPTNPGTNPTVTIDSSTIQNTDYALYASAGTATVTNSALQFNFLGAVQVSDGTNVGGIDLSGGGNAAICSSLNEFSGGAAAAAYEGINVYNGTDAGLAADNVAWDSATPDYFSCSDPTSTATCSCKATSCSATAPFDDEDAVQDSATTGSITQTNATQSALAGDAGCK